MNGIKPGRIFVNKASDNQLMEQVKNGQVEKLAILFERHHVMLYNFFLRLTGDRSISEDLVQDVFTRILKYRSSYLGQSKFVIWLYKIARNAHIDHLRKKKSDIPLDEQMVSPASQEVSLAEKVEHNQEIVWLNQALARLPVKKREVLILSRYHELRYREIAELFGCRIGTVKALVHRSIKELGKMYLELSGGIVS